MWPDLMTSGRNSKTTSTTTATVCDNLPVVTQDMVTQAASDPFHRYRVPGTNVILYDVGAEDLGKKYINKDGLMVAGIDEGIDDMIDEGRNDGVDNDGDWNRLTDDVGLDGAASTGDER